MNAMGMNRQTGRFITENAHIAQSVQDILITPVGSRVMRRDYGSLLFSLLDKPENPALKLQLMAAYFSALLRFEPRIRLEKSTSNNVQRPPRLQLWRKLSKAAPCLPSIYLKISLILQ
ncbi:MAG TPA: GPW/gp25 family protein [Arsenophonus sp.]